MNFIEVQYTKSGILYTFYKKKINFGLITWEVDSENITLEQALRKYPQITHAWRPKTRSIVLPPNTVYFGSYYD